MNLVERLHEAGRRLSPRERLLIGAALSIAFGLTAVYGVMLPGQAAARSAADRNARAAADLAEARDLAVGLGSAASVTEDTLATLTASASARGLKVLDARLSDGAAVLRLASPGSIDVLAWIAEQGGSAALTSLSITAEIDGGVAADAAFGSEP